MTMVTMTEIIGADVVNLRGLRTERSPAGSRDPSVSAARSRRSAAPNWYSLEGITEPDEREIP
jgi:hypothetical protein